jgi:hypothetical protein
LQVARAGRFGTKGLAISFVASQDDATILDKVQERFEVNVAELPAVIEHADYTGSVTRLHSLWVNVTHLVLQQQCRRTVPSKVPLLLLGWLLVFHFCMSKKLKSDFHTDTYV